MKEVHVSGCMVLWVQHRPFRNKSEVGVVKSTLLTPSNHGCVNLLWKTAFMILYL